MPAANCSTIPAAQASDRLSRTPYQRSTAPSTAHNTVVDLGAEGEWDGDRQESRTDAKLGAFYDFRSTDRAGRTAVATGRNSRGPRWPRSRPAPCGSCRMPCWKPAAANRRAEKKQSVRDAALARRVEHDHEDRQCRKDQGENNQECFDRGEVFRTIGAAAPGEADQESEGEGGEVQKAPALEPVHGDDEGVKQQVITEQHDIVAAASRGEDWREKGARDAQRRERLRVLACRHEYADGADACEREKSWRGADHLVAREHEVGNEIKNGESTALQRMAEHLVHAFGDAAVAEPDHRHGGDCAQCQPDRNRHESVLHGEAQSGGHAEEQQYDADFGEQVATDQPVPGTGKIVGFGRCCWSSFDAWRVGLA